MVSKTSKLSNSKWLLSSGICCWDFCSVLPVFINLPCVNKLLQLQVLYCITCQNIVMTRERWMDNDWLKLMSGHWLLVKLTWKESIQYAWCDWWGGMERLLLWGADCDFYVVSPAQRTGKQGSFSYFRRGRLSTSLR